MVYQLTSAPIVAGCVDRRAARRRPLDARPLRGRQRLDPPRGNVRPSRGQSRHRRLQRRRRVRRRRLSSRAIGISISTATARGTRATCGPSSATQDDLPVTGDWDDDGKTDIGIYGPAWARDPWAIQHEPGLPDCGQLSRRSPLAKTKNVPPTADEATSGGRMLKRTAQGKPRADLIDHVFHYGTPGDVPVTGDWNGDGIRTIGVFRDGEWTLDLDGDGRFTETDGRYAFGQAGDLPVIGDFNGDGVDEIGVYRDGQWIIDTNGNRQIDAHDTVFALGDSGRHAGRRRLGRRRHGRPGHVPLDGSVDWQRLGRHGQPAVAEGGVSSASRPRILDYWNIFAKHDSMFQKSLLLSHPSSV